MADEYVIVLTTVPAEGEEGTRLATALVDERLAACVNLLPPMLSTYRWEGKVSSETERQLIAKTSRSRVPALWARLRELHPYDVPEFIVLPIQDGSAPYLEWIAESTRPDA